jgi:hypothetical protein
MMQGYRTSPTYSARCDWIRGIVDGEPFQENKAQSKAQSTPSTPSCCPVDPPNLQPDRNIS